MNPNLTSAFKTGVLRPSSVRIPRKDFWAPITTSLVMILFCLVVSPQRTFWNDEVFSWFFVADPSFSHMLQAFNDKLNNTPLLYFALGWGWSQLFGAGELSLRLFSCLGFCVAYFIIWIVLHKRFGFWPATIATTSVFMTSSIILYQIHEARMYGLYLALAAGALYLYDAAGKQKKVGWKLVLLTFLIHTAIMHTHLFGMFYVAAFLGASVVRDIIQKNWQPWIYAAMLAGGATFIFYYPAFVIQADAGSPRSWLPLPGIEAMEDYLLLQNTSFVSASVFVIIGIWLLVQHWLFPYLYQEIKQERPNLANFYSMQVISFFLLMVPIGTWVLSYLIRPIHWDRYLIPTTIGVAILVAFLVELLFFPYSETTSNPWRDPKYKSSARLWNYQIIPVMVTVLFLLNPIHKILFYDLTANQDVFFSVAKKYPQLPIIVQTSEFLEIYYNATPENKDRFFFMLDEVAASKKGSGAFDLQFNKHMEAFKRQYPDYFKNQIIKTDDFLQSHSRFLIIDYPHYDKQCPYLVESTADGSWFSETHCPQWVEYRILSNPDYQVTVLQSGFEPVPLPVKESYKSIAILLVERKGDIHKN